METNRQRQKIVSVFFFPKFQIPMRIHITKNLGYMLYTYYLNECILFLFFSIFFFIYFFLFVSVLGVCVCVCLFSGFWWLLVLCAHGRQNWIICWQLPHTLTRTYPLTSSAYFSINVIRFVVVFVVIVCSSFFLISPNIHPLDSLSFDLFLFMNAHFLVYNRRSSSSSGGKKTEKLNEWNEMNACNHQK